MSKSAAFSLAEVMVTLIVLGIIAMITVPNLVDSSNQRIYQAAANKADYVVSQEAMRLQTDCPRFRCNGAYDSAAARLKQLLDGVKANEKIKYTVSVSSDNKIYVLATIEGDDVPIMYTVLNTGRGTRSTSNEVGTAAGTANLYKVGTNTSFYTANSNVKIEKNPAGKDCQVKYNSQPGKPVCE